jgi:hypothetical protein
MAGRRTAIFCDQKRSLLVDRRQLDVSVGSMVLL